MTVPVKTGPHLTVAKCFLILWFDWEDQNHYNGAWVLHFCNLQVDQVYNQSDNGRAVKGVRWWCLYFTNWRMRTLLGEAGLAWQLVMVGSGLVPGGSLSQQAPGFPLTSSSPGFVSLLSPSLCFSPEYFDKMSLAVKWSEMSCLFSWLKVITVQCEGYLTFL